jgi:hypothetical protein
MRKGTHEQTTTQEAACATPRALPGEGAFRAIVTRLAELGYADDITWAESLMAPTSAYDFACELVFVIINSGMKHSIALGIHRRVLRAWQSDQPIFSVFKHAGKARAIDMIFRSGERLLNEYIAADDKLDFLESIPWIGPITKYHAAKNFGLDVVKPDVHLQRLSAAYGTTPEDLCQHYAAATGYRIATIDTILWRACAVNILDSKTGTLHLHHDALTHAQLWNASDRMLASSL